jgi:hypothetical protein
VRSFSSPNKLGKRERWRQNLAYINQSRLHEFVTPLNLEPTAKSPDRQIFTTNLQEDHGRASIARF